MALADALAEEYQLIAQHGILLQVISDRFDNQSIFLVAFCY